MLIRCCRCGRSLCEIDPPAVEENEIARALRAAGRFGLGSVIPVDEVMKLLSPTAETIGENFKPRCPDGC